MHNNQSYLLSGTYTWPSGNVYDGEWKDDRRTGHGSEIIPHLFLQTKRHLMKYLFLAGTYRWTDGDVYEGEYLDGMQHGQGKRTIEAHISCSFQKDGSHQYQEPKLCLDYVFSRVTILRCRTLSCVLCEGRKGKCSQGSEAAFHLSSSYSLKNHRA